MIFLVPDNYSRKREKENILACCGVRFYEDLCILRHLVLHVCIARDTGVIGTYIGKERRCLVSWFTTGRRIQGSILNPLPYLRVDVSLFSICLAPECSRST